MKTDSHGVPVAPRMAWRLVDDGVSKGLKREDAFGGHKESGSDGHEQRLLDVLTDIILDCQELSGDDQLLKGARKNTLDVRRCATVVNLQSLARLEPAA